MVAKTKYSLAPLVSKRAVWLGLCALILAAVPQRADAVILMEVIGQLTLFEIEGIDFSSYATTPRTKLSVEDTDIGHRGIVEVEGQRERESTLTLLASGREDPDQIVSIAVDVKPLCGPATRRSYELNARGVAVGPQRVTDPALAALEAPLIVRFRLRHETVNPDTGIRRSQYRLTSIEPRQ